MNIENIQMEQLDEEQREFAEIIGIEAYRKVLAYYAGCWIYIRTPERIGKKKRDEEIYQKFNGGNYNQLAREYHLSESSIRKIIRNARKK